MTKSDKKFIADVISLGCIVSNSECSGRTTYHHCGTYIGGGRNHKKGIGLCWEHHLGDNGIDGKRMGKRVWEARYGTEEALMAKTRDKLRQRQICQGAAA